MDNQLAPRTEIKQWALYAGRTYKIVGECQVNMAPGWILETQKGRIAVEKCEVEAY